MDYKEEYLNALERAKKGLPIDEVFPELKESEDERIRKLLVWQVHRNIEDETNDLAQSVYDGIKGHDPDLEESIEDWKKCLAYLEKQKERERIVPEREATDFEIEVHEIIAQARSDKRLADKDVLEQFEREAACALMWKAEKQKEQKPAEWSEEDEKKIANKQEQPEVDMENYLENYFKGWHVEEEIGLTKPDGWSCIVDDLKDIARHFYELGLNARKEE